MLFCTYNLSNNSVIQLQITILSQLIVQFIFRIQNYFFRKDYMQLMLLIPKTAEFRILLYFVKETGKYVSMNTKV